MKKFTFQKRFVLTIFTMLLFAAVNAQYLETFSTANKGYLYNNADDFTGVNWTLSPWNNAYRLYDDYFQTFDGKLNGEEFDEEVCWQSPLLNISTAGVVSFSVDLSWQNFDAGDYMNLEYDINSSGTYTSVPNVVGGGTRTVEYTSGSNSGSTTISLNSLSGNTLSLRVCIFTNDTLEYTNIDNVSVPNAGVSLACEGDVYLSSQAEVDAFDCTLITGNLTIQGGDITDLTPLSSLVSVGGFLFITSNFTLPNLDGLSSLISVGGDIYFQSNHVLTNVDGLSSLSSVGGYLWFYYNSAIANLDGLSSLASVGGDLNIYNNSNLTNLDGLSSLSSVGGYLNIQLNSALTEFCGLFPLLNGGGLTGSYTVSFNAENPTQQEIIDGGACPVICPGDVTLSSQAEVDVFTCNEVTGNLTISGADITDLSPLSSLSSVGGLRIAYNTNLVNLDGLSSLSSVGGVFYINSNTALTNLDGLSSLSSVGGVLGISYNNALTNLDGLSSLSSVGGYYLYIGDNTALTNLDGLSSLTLVGGFLEIRNNTALAEFCGLFPLLNGGGLGGSYTVTGNAANPTQQDIIDGGACGSCDAPTVTTKNTTVELDADGNASIVALDILEPTTFTDLTSTASWLGYVGVFEEGVFVAGDITAIGDVKSTIDAGADQITLQPNFNTFYPDNFDSPVLQGSTYIEDFGTLAGGASFSFTGSVASNTLDPMYEAFAFIRIFDDSFNFLEEIDDPLITGNDFTVQYNNTQPDAYIFQYGFTVEGPSGAYGDEASLGNAVAQGMTLNVAPYSSCGLVSVEISQSEFDCSNLGANEVTVTATDSNGEVSTGTAIVTVEDNEAPVLTVTSTPITLWPPNHKYETIDMSQLFVSVEDNCGDLSIYDVYITSVSSDEEEDANGNGDGKTVNDIVINSDCNSVDLRKERRGNGNGRVYTIYLAVDDGNGNTGTASCQVHVPHNNGGKAIDDGVALYEEFCGDKSSIASFTGDDIQLRNYPNPFSGSTTIAFTLTETENTTLKVYDTFGKEVAILFDGMAESGQQYTLEFSSGNLPKGIYLYHLQSRNNVSVVKKMILMK